MIKIRRIKDSDVLGLVQVFRDAASGLGRQAYTPEEVEAWARYPDDVEDFRRRVLRGTTLVAEVQGVPVAFGQLDPRCHIAFLYCSTLFARQGICSRIYDWLEWTALAKGVPTLHTEASRLSRPFFERKGFRVAQTERVPYHGVLFERYRMEKEDLGGWGAGGWRRRGQEVNVWGGRGEGRMWAWARDGGVTVEARCPALRA